jgi:DNA-binding transcriptional LysR family regulator
MPLENNADERFSNVMNLADAASLPWVMEPRGAASRHWAEQLCRTAGFEPDIRFETADLQAHVRLVESGNAVALLPGLIYVGVSQTIRLVRLPHNPHRTIFTAVRSHEAHHPALAAFRGLLVQEALSLEVEFRFAN